MSETKDKLDPMEELVEFSAPLDPTGTNQDVLLSVNGETVRVKRGVTVTVKRKFVQVWDQSSAQRLAAHKIMEKAQEGAKAPAMAM